MIAYSCPNCLLAFLIGHEVYWDLSGGCTLYVCVACGTMHKIEHPVNKPDMLFVAGGPVFEKIGPGNDPFVRQTWRFVGELFTPPTVRGERGFPQRFRTVSLDSVVCGHCANVGSLVSNEWPTDCNGKQPVFDERCPLCKQSLETAWVECS